MNYTDFPENLEKLRTPIIICDERGLVIYKNSAAVRNVRLPRRNTSMLTHLGQTEKGELCRLFERKKPSVLTVQTGDRNARALVTHYTRDGKECSLWVFISLLQTGSVSGMFAEMDASLTVIARDICKCIQSIDEFSRALPDQPTAAGLEKLDERLHRIIDSIIEHRRGWLLDLGDALDLLYEAIDRSLRKYGYHLNRREEFDRIPKWDAGAGTVRVLIDLYAFFTLYLHLILFCCDCAPMRHIDMNVRMESGAEDAYYMELAFTLPYPPFYTDGDRYSDDLSALIALSPKNRFELQLFEAYSRAQGFHMSYRITHEVENNMRFRMKLPVVQKVRLRSGEESMNERLFVQHDLTLYFWHMVKERLEDNEE